MAIFGYHPDLIDFSFVIAGLLIGKSVGVKISNRLFGENSSEIFKTKKDFTVLAVALAGSLAGLGADKIVYNKHYIEEVNKYVQASTNNIPALKKDLKVVVKKGVKNSLDNFLNSVQKINGEDLKVVRGFIDAFIKDGKLGNLDKRQIIQKTLAYTKNIVKLSNIINNSRKLNISDDTMKKLIEMREMNINLIKGLAEYATTNLSDKNIVNFTLEQLAAKNNNNEYLATIDLILKNINGNDYNLPKFQQHQENHLSM